MLMNQKPQNKIKKYINQRRRIGLLPNRPSPPRPSPPRPSPPANPKNRPNSKPEVSSTDPVLNLNPSFSDSAASAAG
jgi:hypothetical protein